MQDREVHPTVISVEKVSSIVGPEEPLEEEVARAGVVPATPIPTKYSDCEPNGFGSVYGYSPR